MPTTAIALRIHPPTVSPTRGRSSEKLPTDRAVSGVVRRASRSAANSQLALGALRDQRQDRASACDPVADGLERPLSGRPTFALSGPRYSSTGRRVRDNFPRARGAPRQTSHGPLQRIVRGYIYIPQEKIPT